ncbi:MAG: DUF6913 domain-containing protein [Flavobacterium sp.]
MFFNWFKNFFLKRKLNKIVSNIATFSLSQKAQTVGVLVDETAFFQARALHQTLIAFGFQEEDIFILTFNNIKSLKSEGAYPAFGWQDISAGLKIKTGKVATFVQQPFDVLVSYYDSHNSLLQWITYQSKASSKVGFYEVDHRLNNVIINTSINNYKQFVQEFVRVLRVIETN